MKWLYLILFSLVAMVSQMLWLNFGAMGIFLQQNYQIDELTASLPILVFPVFYCLLSVNAGALIDRKGYKPVVAFGAILMTLGAVVRIFHESFAVLMIGQSLIAIAQPYIVNGISKLVADWFDEKDAGGAIGIGTGFLFIGMGIGIGVSPAIAGEDGSGYGTMLIVMAAITAVTSLLFVFVVKPNKASTASVTSVGGLKDFSFLLKNKNILILNLISFAALGFFNGISGYLEQMLVEQGIKSEDGGMVAAALIGGGILGAFIVPMISDKIKKRKIVMIIAALGAIALAYPVMTGNNITMLYILGGLLGFVFLPGYAILLTASEEEAGKDKAGASTGLIMFSGNLGGIVVVFLAPVLKGEGSWSPAVYLCMALLVIATLGAFVMKETFKQKA
jgi:predicted MFS family arabinose efflux permease